MTATLLSLQKMKFYAKDLLMPQDALFRLGLPMMQHQTYSVSSQAKAALLAGGLKMTQGTQPVRQIMMSARASTPLLLAVLYRLVRTAAARACRAPALRTRPFLRHCGAAACLEMCKPQRTLMARLPLAAPPQSCRSVRM